MKDLIRKILKESEEDFSWVNIDNLEEIRNLSHKVDIAEEVIKKVKHYKGWTIHQDGFDGVVYWTGNGEYTGMATPYWDHDNMVPVDVTWDDNYANLQSIEIPEFKYVIELEDWFKKNYFEFVYQELTSFKRGNETRGDI